MDCSLQPTKNKYKRSIILTSWAPVGAKKCSLRDEVLDSKEYLPVDIESQQKSKCTRAESHTSWPVFRGGLLKPLVVVIENYSAK